MRIISCEYMPDKKPKKTIKKIEKTISKKIALFGLLINRSGYCFDGYRTFDIQLDCEKSKSMAKYVKKIIKEIFKKHKEAPDYLSIVKVKY